MMKTLPSNFTRDGFLFRQLAREGDVALFEKSKPGHSRPGYEVVIVQRHPPQTIHGRDYPERESMPASESWGVLGWSYSDLNPAKTKFDALVTSRANAPFALTPFPNGASQAICSASGDASPSAAPREKG